jgi:hypothetical protein
MPFLTHVYTTDVETGAFLDETIPGLESMGTIPFRDRKDLIRNLVRLMPSIPGVILCHRKTGECIRVLSRRYLHIRDLYGNAPNVQRRVIELLKNPDMLHEYEVTFPHLRSEVRATRRDMSSFIRWLLFQYKDRYLRKNKPDTEHPERYMPSVVHGMLIQLSNRYRDRREKYTVTSLTQILLAEFDAIKLDRALNAARTHWMTHGFPVLANQQHSTPSS